jgi:ribosomal protein L19E
MKIRKRLNLLKKHIFLDFSKFFKIYTKIKGQELGYNMFSNLVLLD